MRSFYVLVFLVCVGFAAESAVPQLQDFDTNQFGTAGGIVRIKSGAHLTNPIVANGIAPTNANYLLFDFTNSLVPIAKVLVPGANVVFSPNATGIVLSVTAAGTNGFQDPGANGMVVRVATNTSVARQILGTTDQIAVDNGTGVGGDPTIRLIGPWTNNAGVVQLTTSTNHALANNHIAFKEGQPNKSWFNGSPSDFLIGLNYRENLTNAVDFNTIWFGADGIRSYMSYGAFDADTDGTGITGVNSLIYSGDEDGLGVQPLTTNKVGTMIALFGNASFKGTNTSDGVVGQWGIASIQGGGSTPSLVGTYSEAIVIDGRATRAAATFSHAETSVNVDHLDSMLGEIQTFGGKLTNAYLLHASSPLITGGSIGTIYGLKVDSQSSATTNFAIYTDLGKVDFGDNLSTRKGRTINRFATATNYTLTVANHYLVSTATQTNTLPAANAVAAGQVFIIKNKAGTTTVRPAGADTIDGVAADDVFAAKASNTYISDGVSNWEKN